MTNIKQLIMMLVALFAISTGAWADETVFEYADPMVGTLTQGTGTSATTVTINSESVKAIKFGNSYVYAEGKYITIAPTSGSFKKGDVVSIAGCIRNGNAEYYAKAGIYTAEGATQLYETANVVNAQLSTDAPVVETYTLTQDAEKLLIARSTGNTALYITTLKVLRTASAPAGTALTPDATRKIWTLDAMPAGDVELQVAYYPGMLTLPASLPGGTLSVVGLTAPFTKLEVLDAWENDNTLLSAAHLPGFKEMSDDAAQKWEGAPKEGLASLIYGFEGTKAKTADYVGGIFALSGTQDLTLSTVKTASADAEIYYSSEAQLPAGFEQDEKGNIYVADKTEFKVKATPANGFRLTSLMFGEQDITDQVDADGIATLTMPEGENDITLTATFSDEYDLAFNAANANTIEAGKATVKVGDTDKTADIDADHKLKAVKMGSTVTITTKEGYKFRKVEVKKTGSAVLAPALENGATVVIICNWGYATTTFTYTNNGGTFSGQASGYDANYFHNGLELNGKNLSFGASNVDLPDYLSVGITFNTGSSAYSYTGKGQDFVSFTISVNGTDVTDQLSELK